MSREPSGSFPFRSERRPRPIESDASKTIVESHGGKIGVRGNDGPESTFQVSIPRS